jgi:hypothetical protein
VGKTDWVPEKKNNSQDNWNQKRYRIAWKITYHTWRFWGHLTHIDDHHEQVQVLEYGAIYFI